MNIPKVHVNNQFIYLFYINFKLHKTIIVSLDVENRFNIFLNNLESIYLEIIENIKNINKKCGKVYDSNPLKVYLNINNLELYSSYLNGLMKEEREISLYPLNKEDIEYFRMLNSKQSNLLSFLFKKNNFLE